MTVNEFAGHHQSLLLVALICSLLPILLIAAVSAYQLYADIGQREEAELRRLKAAGMSPSLSPTPLSPLSLNRAGRDSPPLPEPSPPSRVRGNRVRGDAGQPLINSVSAVYDTFSYREEHSRRTTRSTQQAMQSESGQRRLH